MCHICRLSHMWEPAYFIWLVLPIGDVNFSMNVGREASGVGCSHVNFTYPSLPPQAPTTYIKKLQLAEKLIYVSPTQ